MLHGFTEACPCGGQGLFIVTREKTREVWEVWVLASTQGW